MMTLDDYINERKKKDPEFARGFEEGYEQFKIGVLLREMREEAGLTQQQLADKLNTKKSAISRIENHSEDIRLVTLKKYVGALGKKLEISFG
jgi:DNA-binding XRE family transcriptional regulator